MTNKPIHIISFIAILVCGTSLYAQLSTCQNLGFELGNFTNWEGTTWNYSFKPDNEITTPPVDGIKPRRHTIITNQNAYDAVTGNELKLIPPGFNYSCRLGDVITDFDEFNTRCWHQNMRYTMDIDEGNALLILKYALVLEFADDHEEDQEPRFRFTLYDSNGDTLPGCANYDVFATNKALEGFHFIEDGGYFGDVMWRDWTTIGFDLSDYMGETITIEFLTADCTRTHHFGYGYFVASCQPLNINLRNCADDTVATLTAPTGFMNYSWHNRNGVKVGDRQLLQIKDAKEGDVYTCNMTSESGCDVSVSTTIESYIPVLEFDSYMLDCHSNTVQLTNQSTTNNGHLAYLWDFGDGNSSMEPEPEYTFITSGLHEVQLSVVNLPSACTDTLTQVVESFSPPLVFINGDSIYCKDDSVTLYANGAFEYNWSNGLKADSISIGNPGGDYWMVGKSSTGCISDTMRRNVQEEEKWALLDVGDSAICSGGTAVLKAEGATNYQWSNGVTSDSIIIDTSGIYTCRGFSPLNCSKSLTFSPELIPLPNATFSLSPETINSRDNLISGNAMAEPDVSYHWNMDDDYEYTASSVNHRYLIDPEIKFYTINLTATDKYGCEDSSSQILEVVPFVPNVFSPNNDGINDIFMPGYSLKIYDRNGISIFSGEGGWDGRYQGKPASPDTYFYTIYYENISGQENGLKGHVTLVR